MAELILAHDLGTTGNKASLFDTEGSLLRSAFAGYATSYPQPGWAEQDPAVWWQAVVGSTQELLRQSPPRLAARDVKAISFSGQMMGCLPVDPSGRPLSASIIWADQRAEGEAALIRQRVGAAQLYEITGHRASSNYTAAKTL